MPLFVLGVGIAEPPAAFRAMHGRRISRTARRYATRSDTGAPGARSRLPLPLSPRVSILRVVFLSFSVCGRVHTTGMTYSKLYLTELYVPCRFTVILFRFALRIRLKGSVESR